MGNDVFSRSNQVVTGNEISGRAYNLLIGGCLLWGFVINYFMVTLIPTAPIENVNPFIFLLTYFAFAFSGSFIMGKSQNPAISFLGYNLIILPIGFVLNLVVNQYDPNIVGRALLATGIVTIIMMVASAINPNAFLRLGRVLFFSLLFVIIAEFTLLLLGAAPTIMDWIVAFIFCGYIGYDWARANHIPKTMDNAIDCAAALYLDIINLFIRILDIIGRK